MTSINNDKPINLIIGNGFNIAFHNLRSELLFHEPFANLTENYSTIYTDILSSQFSQCSDACRRYIDWFKQHKICDTEKILKILADYENLRQLLQNDIALGNGMANPLGLSLTKDIDINEICNNIKVTFFCEMKRRMIGLCNKLEGFAIGCPSNGQFDYKACLDNLSGFKIIATLNFDWLLYYLTLKDSPCRFSDGFEEGINY